MKKLLLGMAVLCVLGLLLSAIEKISETPHEKKMRELEEKIEMIKRNPSGYLREKGKLKAEQALPPKKVEPTPRIYQCMQTADCTFTDWGSGSQKKMYFVVLETLWKEFDRKDKTVLESLLKEKATEGYLSTDKIGVMLSRGKDERGYLYMDREEPFPEGK
jgi:hypothetical protein